MQGESAARFGANHLRGGAEDAITDIDPAARTRMRKANEQGTCTSLPRSVARDSRGMALDHACHQRGAPHFICEAGGPAGAKRGRARDLRGKRRALLAVRPRTVARHVDHQRIGRFVAGG